MLEDPPHLLQSHIRRFWEAEEHEDPAQKTEASVEAKGARRRHALHHREEGRTNDNVGTPIEDVDHLKCKL